MSSYAILRVQKRSLGQAAAMARHALRESSTPNADPDKLAENTVMGPNTAAGIMGALRSKLPEKRRKDAVPCIELFIGASPEAMRAMKRKDQDRYFKRAMVWAGERFGGKTNIISAVIHRDESTPHLQLLLVPLVDGKLNAKKLVGGRNDMVQMQTDFAEIVGKPSGLKRGEKGSRAKHTTIRQFYGAIEAAGGANALPPRVRVPEALPKPGMFVNESARAAYAAREAERAKALSANKSRQAEIERLAALGIAVHGRGRRRLASAESLIAKAEERTLQANELLARQREEFNARSAELARVTDQVERTREALGSGVLLREREQLQAEVAELRTEVRQRGRTSP